MVRRCDGLLAVPLLHPALAWCGCGCFCRGACMNDAHWQGFNFSLVHDSEVVDVNRLHDATQLQGAGARAGHLSLVSRAWIAAEEGSPVVRLSED